MLSHNSNGRFAVVTGDGEYIIYTALAWRKKSFGAALLYLFYFCLFIRIDVYRGSTSVHTCTYPATEGAALNFVWALDLYSYLYLLRRRARLRST